MRRRYTACGTPVFIFKTYTDFRHPQIACIEIRLQFLLTVYVPYIPPGSNNYYLEKLFHGLDGLFDGRKVFLRGFPHGIYTLKLLSLRPVFSCYLTLIN